jgi:orotidine-5'-phosphate decarboxylase
MGAETRARASARLIVALDIEGFDAAKRLIDELTPTVGGFAIGYMAMAEGWDRRAVDLIRERSEKRIIFYDPHLNATPRITATAVAAYARWGITHLSVCGTAGQQSIRAAVESRGPIAIVVTTVLTSFDENDIRCEYGRRSDEVVSEHARAANLAGAQGLLCSPQELKIIREYSHVERLTKIVNGIRFRDFPLKKDDFQRILAPGDAIQAGADYLLVGRPIVEPPAGIKSPQEAVERILDEIVLASTPAGA